METKRSLSMHRLLIFILLIQTANADSWVCKNKGKHFFTNTPTNSSEQMCKPFELARGSLSWVSREAMELITKDRVSTQSSRSDEEGVRSSLNYKDVNTKNSRRSARGLNRGCRLRGRITSDYVGKAELEISRGALTTDRFRISLPGGSFDWEQIVDGHCRTPQVKVRLLK